MKLSEANMLNFGCVCSDSLVNGKAGSHFIGSQKNLKEIYFLISTMTSLICHSESQTDSGVAHMQHKKIPQNSLNQLKCWNLLCGITL